jgi:hypothetical protein
MPKRGRKQTNPIVRKTLPDMLDLLDARVRRADVDDAEVVDLIERLVRFVRRPQPALVLVEEEVLPVGDVGFGEVVGRALLAERPRVRTLDGLTDGGGFGRGFDGGGFATGGGVDLGLWGLSGTERERERDETERLCVSERLM